MRHIFKMILFVMIVLLSPLCTKRQTLKKEPEEQIRRVEEIMNEYQDDKTQQKELKEEKE